MRVICAFQANTGSDFHHSMIKAINAYNKAMMIDNPLERAQVMTEAVSMEDAAWLFYLAAHEVNKCVEFEEIQEAIIMDGAFPRLVSDSGASSEEDVTLSYPINFVNVATFAAAGIFDEIKKKKLAA